MTQQQVADAIGVSRAAVSQWEADEPEKRTTPSYENLDSLASCLGATMNDFFEYAALPPEQIQREAKQFLDHQAYEMLELGYAPIDEQLISIPELDVRLCAGTGGFEVQRVPEESGESVYYKKSWLTKRGYKPENLVRLSVTGSSMEPALFDGDKVTLNLASKTPKNGFAFAVMLDGQPAIKRMLKRNNQWWITSDNPSYSKFDIELESTEIIIGEAVDKSSSVI